MKLRSTYQTVVGGESDRQLDHLISKRVSATGVMLEALWLHQYCHLPSRIEIATQKRDRWYLELFFSGATGALGELEPGDMKIGPETLLGVERTAGPIEQDHYI